MGQSLAIIPPSQPTGAAASLHGAGAGQAAALRGGGQHGWARSPALCRSMLHCTNWDAVKPDCVEPTIGSWPEAA